LQQQFVSEATPVLYWWHIAIQFEHALPAAPAIDAGKTHA
jgi:hypothetical protein